MISQNSLFGQVSLVLALNSEADKTLQFVSLNSLDLKSLVLDALANLAAFFEVIEADLLGRLGVHTDLVTDGLGVSTESTVSLMLKLTLFVLLLFLLLDHTEEFIAFGLSLLGHHDLFLDELLAAGEVKIL